VPPVCSKYFDWELRQGGQPGRRPRGARRVERLAKLAEDIQWEGGQALAVALDVTNRASVEAAFDTAESQFGCVDVLVNNSGIGSPRGFLEMSEGDWRDMLVF
jgi:NAD(P)-dependent dehydrogenase (short-subunit alcohol dehydrogenase family)